MSEDNRRNKINSEDARKLKDADNIRLEEKDNVGTPSGDFKYQNVHELREAAYDYLTSHKVEGTRWDKDYYFFKPANTKYGSHQWLWDSGFHMILWAYEKPENSIRDLRTMLKFQQPNGFIPEMIYWTEKDWPNKVMDCFFGYSNSKYTDISQMPMLGYSLRAIWKNTKDEAVLKEFLPKLVEYLKWWDNERDPDDDGLLSIIHPWESGLDASPLYDPAHGVHDPGFWALYPKFLFLLFKYQHKAKWNIKKILKRGWFNFEDVGVCAVYADNWDVLGTLAGDLGDKHTEEFCHLKSKEYQIKIIEKCWDDKAQQFVSYYHQKDKELVSEIETIQSLFPLLFRELPKDIEKILVEKLKDPTKFGSPYPVPTTALSEIEFDPLDSRLMWRGPTWPNTNYFIIEGLLKHGYTGLAEDIVDKWAQMHLKNGIYEYHNPLTGEAEGQEGLGMANMIVPVLHRLGRL